MPNGIIFPRSFRKSTHPYFYTTCVKHTPLSDVNGTKRLDCYFNDDKDYNIEIHILFPIAANLNFAHVVFSVAVKFIDNDSLW